MKFKVCSYKKEKLVSMFNDQGIETIDECKERINWWKEMRRNAIDTQFVIIDKEQDKIIEVI